MLKLTTDKHEASRGLSATAELLVSFSCKILKNIVTVVNDRNIAIPFGMEKLEWPTVMIVREYCRYYSATIIRMAGVENTSTAIWLAALTAFVNFVFTFVGLFLVDRIGRRPLTLGSLAGELHISL